MVGGSLRVLRLLPPLKLVAKYQIKSNPIHETYYPVFVGVMLVVNVLFSM